MRTPGEGGGQDDDEIIDVLAPDKAAEAADRGAEIAASRVIEELPEIEPREAVLERDEPREEVRADRDQEEREPRESRRRGETQDDYSRRVQGRINREIALRRRTERRLEEQTVLNDEMRDRLAKVERRQSVSDITDDAKKKISDIEREIEAIKVKLAAAVEAGDTKMQMDINIELATKISEKTVILKRSEYQAEQARTTAAADPGTQGQPSAADQRVARMTSRWQTANRKWWNLNRFKDVRDDAIELDKDLRQEVRSGSLDLEEYSDEYFAELSTRLKENYPDLDVRGLDGEVIEAEPDDLDRDARRRDDDRGRDREDPPARRGRERDPPPKRRSHVGGNMGTRDGRRTPNDARTLAAQGRVRLTEADYAQMRTYGLNPNDPKQKKRFAEERMRTILTEGRDDGRRGGGR